MKIRPLWLATGLGLALIFLAGGLWSQVKPTHTPERKVSFYQDSMHPWIKSDHPGKCTICDMDLTPIYEGQKAFGTSDNLVVLNSNNVTVLNVQRDEVKRLALSRSLRVAGTLEANESRKTVVSAPARGRIDALFVEYAGVEVEQGQKLITLFSPELMQLRKTLLAVRSVNQGASNIVTQSNVDSGLYTGNILAPQSGVVVERNVYNGQYVAEGDRLLTIADASVLWFRFDVYQQQLPWVEPGQKIEVAVQGVPGKVFPAAISFVEPTINENTRTVKVRADIANPIEGTGGQKQRRLKFGMYAEGVVRAELPSALAVPRSAILFPGRGAYAYVEKGNGAYERRSVKLGREGDDYWEILGGLEPGESVVTSGNVLIDAQAQFNRGGEIKPTEPREFTAMEPAACQMPDGATMSHTTTASLSDAPVSIQKPPLAPHAGMAQSSAGTTSATPALADMSKNAMPPAATVPVSTPEVAQPSTNRPVTRAEYSSARMAFKEQMWRNRMALIAAAREQDATNSIRLASNQPQQPTSAPAAVAPAQTQTMTPGESLTQAHYQQLRNVIFEADAVASALAADDLAQFNLHAARLPVVLGPVQKELANSFHWEKLLEPLAALGKGEPAKDLKDARNRFLPFSNGVVAFARQLRNDAPKFPSLKIYHCPMAPEPGLWMQTQGPLRNPFFGSKMLRCGEDVTENAPTTNSKPANES